MKISKLVFFGAVVAIAAFNSCSKDDDSPDDFISSVKGSWKVVKGMDNVKYVHIYSNRTFSQLSAEDAGIRGRTDGVVLATNNQLMFNIPYEEYPYSYIYNYSFSGDTLKLSNTLNSIKMVRDNSAPDTSAWIAPVTSTFSIKAPIDASVDLTYDGTYLWYGNGYESNYLYKINPNTSAKDSISVSQYAWSVEFDGTNLWVSSDGSSTVSKVNISTGATMTTSIAMGAWIYGIARDGIYLWCYSGNENTLYKYNTSTNTVVTKISINADVRGMAFVNGNLYMAANGYLHKCSLNPINTEASFSLAGYYICGVAYDGTSFWVSAYTINSPYQYRILKLTGVN